MSQYLSLKEIKAALKQRTISPSKLPFCKRLGYQDEKEYRIIYLSKDNECEAKSFALSIRTIHRIVINPWAPPGLYEAIEQAILNTKGCENIAVRQSTIINNDTWRRFADQYA